MTINDFPRILASFVARQDGTTWIFWIWNFFAIFVYDLGLPWWAPWFTHGHPVFPTFTLLFAIHRETLQYPIRSAIDKATRYAYKWTR